MIKVLEKLEHFILPYLRFVDIGNRNTASIDKWEKCKHIVAEDLLKAQWIDGKPKNSLKGIFLLVMREIDSGTIKRVIWFASEDSLEIHTMIPGWECIKHMRLPEYE